MWRYHLSPEEKFQPLIKTWIQKEVQGHFTAQMPTYQNPFSKDDLEQAIAYTQYTTREVKETFQAIEIDCAVIPIAEEAMKNLRVDSIFTLHHPDTIKQMTAPNPDATNLFLHVILVVVPKKRGSGHVFGTACVTRRGEDAWSIKYHLESFKLAALTPHGHLNKMSEPNSIWDGEAIKRSPLITHPNAYIKSYESIIYG